MQVFGAHVVLEIVVNRRALHGPALTAAASREAGAGSAWQSFGRRARGALVAVLRGGSRAGSGSGGGGQSHHAVAEKHGGQQRRLSRHS